MPNWPPPCHIPLKKRHGTQQAQTGPEPAADPSDLEPAANQTGPEPAADPSDLEPAANRTGPEPAGTKRAEQPLG